MKTFHELQEGVYDPNIFKAIYLAGGPGSGKSYVVRKTTGGLGLKIVNSDDVFEKIDTLTEIFNVWTDRHEIIYMVNKVYHAEKRLRKYITKKTNGYIDRRVIKHNKWDDTIVIMDKNNNYAKKVYLVRDFLKLEEV